MDKLSMREEQIYVIICAAETPLNLSMTLKRANERYNQQWKPTTISTFITRMAKKQYLTIYRNGRYCYYQPTISLEEYRLTRLRDDIRLLFKGNVEEVISILADIEKKLDIAKMEMVEKISECEENILMFIYDADKDMTMAEIMQGINNKLGRQWKPQTVSTFLARLVRKGYLTMYRKGRYCYYQPVIEERLYKIQKALYVLDVLFDGNIACMKEYIK